MRVLLGVCGGPLGRIWNVWGAFEGYRGLWGVVGNSGGVLRSMGVVWGLGDGLARGVYGGAVGHMMLGVPVISHDFRGWGSL